MKKPLVLLGGVAVLLILIYALMNSSEKRALTETVKTNFIGADSGVVNRIVVNRLGESVEFSKANEIWNVLDAGKQQRADQMVLAQIANIASNLTVGDIISSNPEKQMLFQVDTLMGKRVTFFRDSQELGQLVVGKAGGDFRSTYVRKPESSDVYLAQSALSRFFDRPARGYRDRIVAPLDTSRINRIEIASKEFNYSLVRLDSIWSVTGDKTPTFVADHGKAQQILGLLGNLRVADFVSDADRDTINFATAQDMVTAHLNDGSSVSMVFRAKTAEARDFYVRFSTSPDLFTVFEGTHKSLIKKPEDFKPGA